MCYTTGPPQIYRHSWFQSLYGLSVLPDQQRSRNVPPGGGGGCQDTGRQSRQWDRICRLFQSPQARVPEPRTQAADSTRRSTTEVPVRSRSATSPGPGDTFSGESPDYKCSLVTVSGLKEVPAHQLPGNCWWTCTSDEIKMIKQRRV